VEDDARTRFRDLYELHYNLIFRTCRRRLGNAASAEDATAEVFRVAWQRMSAGTEVDIRWLYRTARNVVGNEYRRLSRSRALLEKASNSSIEQHADTSDLSADLRQALKKLRVQERELLFMAYWEDLTPGEMAAILNCQETALRMRLSRARAALKRALDTTPDEKREEVIAVG
jgi:RNA polymerase sigma factor (sigma-70 family)